MTTKVKNIDKEEHEALDGLGDSEGLLDEVGDDAPQDERSAPFIDEEEEVM
jgi:hypothetical protein